MSITILCSVLMCIIIYYIKLYILIIIINNNILDINLYLTICYNYGFCGLLNKLKKLILYNYNKINIKIIYTIIMAP